MVLFFISFILLFSFQNLLTFGDVSTKDPGLRAKLVVSGLERPTSMAFLAKGDLLVLEKDGIVQRVHGYNILDQPVLNITSIVNSARERGLLGIAIDDGATFDEGESNGSDSKIYLYFTEKIPNDIHKNCDMKNCSSQIVNSLYEYEMKTGKLVNPQLLFSTPFGEEDIGLEHIGGKIIVGPDKRVYITGGDGHPCINYEDCKKSTNKGILHSKTANSNGRNPTGAGGILVVSKDDNSKASDFVVGSDYPLNLYYAYGIRNSFGLDFDPLTGYLWDTENGPFFGDEINLVKPGFNSGWAKIQGIWPITDYHQMTINLEEGFHFPEDDTLLDDDTLIDFNGNGEYSPPEFTWKKSVGLTALKFLESDKLGKEYENDLFVASYTNGLIYHFDLNNDRIDLLTDIPPYNNVGNTESELANFIFAQGFGYLSITDLQVSPDGFLYILTYDGSIWKIVKSGED